MLDLFFGSRIESSATAAPTQYIDTRPFIGAGLVAN
jgi:hypothetical protein